MSMEYHVVHCYDLRSLIDQVNVLLAEGWRPAGGVSVGTGSLNGTIYDRVYVQAVVKALS